jgi:hypothetical protein
VLEGGYKTGLTKRIEKLFGSDVLVVRLDANLLQGSPDLCLLFRYGFWATLEGKTSARARKQPNQDYYVDLMDGMCFSAFIYPENEEAVLHELCQEYQAYRATRVS